MSGHEVTVQVSDVLPRGWSEAWVWSCSCGLRSWSIMRSRQEARLDHVQEHVQRVAPGTLDDCREQVRPR